MLGKDLSASMDQLPDDMIQEAAGAYRKKRTGRAVWPRLVAVAAMLAILLTAVLWPGEGNDSQLITVPGVVRVYAYDLTSGMDVSQMECVALEQGMELPYKYGWNVTLNLYPGVPITLSMPESEFEGAQITFEVTVNGGEFLRKRNSINDGGSMYLGQNFVVGNNQTICWNFFHTNPELWDNANREENDETTEADSVEDLREICFLGGKAYADVIIRADDHIVGCMTVMFYADDLSIPLGSMEYVKCQYYAKLIGAIICPKQDGEYQNVTREQMEELMKDWK